MEWGEGEREVNGEGKSRRTEPDPGNSTTGSLLLRRRQSSSNSAQKA